MAFDAALLEAVQAGDLEAIRTRLEAGADVNAQDREDGPTVLTYATAAAYGAEGAQTRVRCLLELGAQVAAEGPRLPFGTSVHRCAANGYLAALRELLAADGKVAVNAFDDTGFTPLMTCSLKPGRVHEARLLLEAGADVDLRDALHADDTAIGLAALQKNFPMVELLLEAGADPTLPGWMQTSALDEARLWMKGEPTEEERRICERLERAAEARAIRGP